MNHHRPLPMGIVFTVFALGLALLPTVTASATVGVMQIAADTTLTEDHNGKVEIIADNVTLDCAGHKVVGPAAADPNAGIQVFDQSGVTVRNCDVSGFIVGILLHNVQGSTFEGNTLHDNVLGDGGVGIGMTLATGNIVRNNVATGNATAGIHIHGESDGNTIMGNAANGNEQHGIMLGPDADDNIVTGNTATGNGNHGISLNGATGNTVTGNTVTDSGSTGFQLWAAANSNKLSGNVARDNGENGFDIEDSGNNTLDLNQSTGNVDSGFGVRGSSLSNVLSHNGAHLNGESGIEDEILDAMSFTAASATYSGNYCTANGIAGSRPVGLCQEEQVGLVNDASGQWHLRYDAINVTSFYYGNPGDVPFLGDWDCDGNETPGLFRTSDAFAYLRNSNSQGIADIRFFFGNPSDVPLAGDFNGDGCDTLSIYRPSEAKFYIMNELGENEGGLGAADYSFLFGNMGDKPVVGDWDGDGIDEIGLHRETTGFFYYRNTLTTGVADGQFFFGDAGDRFVAGDWGIVDGVETPAMFRPSNSTFYFRWTLTQGNADSEFTWSGAGMNWLPVSGDFTLD